MESFIESGFDTINPARLNSKGMDPARLKEEFGDKLVFRGGGADTQKILPFANSEEVKEHVKRNCEIMAKNGGLVFNKVHNIQANEPLDNILAMLEAIKK